MGARRVILCQFTKYLANGWHTSYMEGGGGGLSADRPVVTNDTWSQQRPTFDTGSTWCWQRDLIGKCERL